MADTANMAKTRPFELTDEMRSVIGVESDPYPSEFTTTGIRAFARGVGYTDPVYFDVAAAQAAGYANLPAPPTYVGVPVFIPGKSDSTYGNPLDTGGRRLDHGLRNVLDGGTSVSYNRVPVAGETLMFTSQVANLEVKESKGLGTMLVITSKQTFRDTEGLTVMTVDAQAIFY
jgi:N-terminal half of MaoC dehydratase